MTDTNLFQNLNALPRLNQAHQWADYIELVALTSEDQLFSQGGLQDVEAECEDVARDMDDIDSEQEIAQSVVFNNDEKINRRWAEIKTCLRSRSLRLEGAWPFEFRNDVLYAKVNASDNLHRLYIALLLASALRFIPENRRKEITASLEEIGYQVFCNLMPTIQINGEFTWVVKPFGAHQQIAEGYKGKLFSKVTKLATDLDAKLVAEENQFHLRDTGDGGLDVVAWHPMGDKLGHIPVAFAQCGCSLEDLAHKQYEAHPVNWANKIHIQHPQANYYFAPHDLRNNSGHWDEHLGQVIMLDRTRILYLAKLYQLSTEHVNWPYVDEAINTRRSMVS